MRFASFAKIREIFRSVRYQVIRWWRLHAVVPKLLRFNAYTGFIGRRLFHYIPFILPHDKSYYGFAHLVKSGDGLFLDIGANDGISAIGFHHIHSDYRIISLEPNRCHEASLRRLVRKLKGFDFQIVGIGQNPGQMTLYVPFFQGVPIYTAASFTRSFVEQSMKNQFGDSACEIVYQELVTPIITIDQLQLNPDIVKIDTEGHDLEVLKGMTQTIQKYRPYIMIEFNPDLFEAQEKLFQQYGYEMFRYVFKRDYFEPFNYHQQQAVFNQNLEAQNIFCIPHEKSGELRRR